MAHHDTRAARLGTRVLITAGWYYRPAWSARRVPCMDAIPFRGNVHVLHKAGCGALTLGDKPFLSGPGKMLIQHHRGLGMCLSWAGTAGRH